MEVSGCFTCICTKLAASLLAAHAELHAAAAAANGGVGDVEVNSVEDGDAEDYNNELPSSAELYGSAELRLNGDHPSQPQSHTAEHDHHSALSNNGVQHVIHDPPTAARHRHSSLVTSLQVRCCLAI